MHAPTHAHTHTHTCTHTHTHAHAHMYTHTHKLTQIHDMVTANSTVVNNYICYTEQKSPSRL